MDIVPSNRRGTFLRGYFTFSANNESHGTISDSFELEIEIPPSFPQDFPKVSETGNRIPRNPDWHNGDTFCLGSPIRLKMILAEKPSLIWFAEKCIIPYLYAISHKLQHGGPFVFDALSHCTPGLIEDYRDILGLDMPDQIKQAVKMLGIKKRLANKLPCPCGCGKRLGRCRFNRTMLALRKIAPRSWFRAHQV